MRERKEGRALICGLALFDRDKKITDRVTETRNFLRSRRTGVPSSNSNRQAVFSRVDNDKQIRLTTYFVTFASLRLRHLSARIPSRSFYVFSFTLLFSRDLDIYEPLTHRRLSSINRNCCNFNRNEALCRFQRLSRASFSLCISYTNCPRGDNDYVNERLFNGSRASQKCFVLRPPDKMYRYRLPAREESISYVIHRSC